MSRVFTTRVAAVAGILVVAGLMTRAVAPAVRAHNGAAVGTPGQVLSQPAARGALTVAAAYVVAANTIDAARPHGDVATLRQVAVPRLAALLAVSRSGLTASQLAAGTVLRARPLTVAGRATVGGAVVTVTAVLSVTPRRGSPMRTATAIGLTAAHTAGGWRVTAVQS
jgi:hypothetical protein